MSGIDDAVARRKVVEQHPPIRMALVVGEQSVLPVGMCLSCGHTMPLAVWSGKYLADVTEGVCGPCRDAALSLRGPCSTERGCFCGK